MCEMFFALGPYVNSTPCGDSHLCTSIVVRIKWWGPQGRLTRSQLHGSLPVWFIIKDSCIAVSDKGIFQKKMKMFVDRRSPFIHLCTQVWKPPNPGSAFVSIPKPNARFLHIPASVTAGIQLQHPRFPLRLREDGRIISVLQQDLGFQSYNHRNVIFWTFLKCLIILMVSSESQAWILSNSTSEFFSTTSSFIKNYMAWKFWALHGNHWKGERVE